MDRLHYLMEEQFMKIDKTNWLPHLKDLPSDIRGYKTCTYLMALEGWRRGLTLKFIIRPGRAIPPSIRFSLSNGEREHLFTVARGDKVAEDAIKICMEKPLTYEYLLKSNVPIPEGKSFEGEVEDGEIIEYANQLGFPLVLKPTDGSSGRGVITNIENIDEFVNALNHVREELNFKSVIVERFIIGEDYRIYVVEDKVIGAYKRISANVIGDGQRTIEQLIEIKNEERKKNPFIEKRLIRVDNEMSSYLELNNYTLNTVPAEDEQVFLRRQGSYLQERDPVDITDTMAKEIKDIAINATKAIPGLHHCDVDMLVNESTGVGVVNEVNSRPQISNHLFPLVGLARDIPKAIIDYYFPETKGVVRNDLFYFDFNPIYDAFRSASAREITIPNIPRETIVSSRFRLTGFLRGKNYENWIRNHAISLKLNGYLKHLRNGQTSVVVAGSPASMERFRHIIKNNTHRRARHTKVIERKWEKQIKVGFEIKKTSVKSDFVELNEVYVQLDKLKREKDALEQTKNAYKKKYQDIEKSLAWKVTTPVRKIGRLTKAVLRSKR